MTGEEWLSGLRAAVDAAVRSGVSPTDAVEALAERHPPEEERRASGSYYTPPAVVDAVLDRALAPLLSGPDTREEAARIRALRLVDPACGTGHFLVAAYLRVRKRLDELYATVNEARSAGMDALATVCGVDLDPRAVALCRARLAVRTVGAPWFDGFTTPRVVVGDALAPDGEAFSWTTAFADVLEEGGFDAVIGNPPWIAHAGRAAQPLPAARKAYYLQTFEAFRGYPTTHGLFVEQASRLLRDGGLLGLVLPGSVAELRGYAPTRRAHDRRCAPCGEQLEFGEHRFRGVIQPSMGLISQRTQDGRTDAPPGSPWLMRRDDLTKTERALLDRLAALPALPAELFGERGLQSNPDAKPHLRETPTPEPPWTVPIREGRDIEEFRLLPPRWHANRDGLGRRLRPADDFMCVDLVIRQTARWPIAAASDGAAFRNSLLAGFGTSEWPTPLLLVLLNSRVVRWLHWQRFRDARQPVLPQVKIGHLRSIPSPPECHGARRARLIAAGQGPLAGPPADRDAIEAAVAESYGLTASEWLHVCGFFERGQFLASGQRLLG